MMQSSMQGGMVPPPMPGLTFPPPSLPQTPQAPATPVAFPPRFLSQTRVAPVERVQEVMETDKEDGELSEDVEATSRPSAGIAVRQRYPEHPRSAPQPTVTPSRVEEVYNPDAPSAGQTTMRTSTKKSAPQASAVVSEADLVQRQREEAKQFIRLLNSHNIGYHALAKEKVDLELLRGMYRSMNLPSEPEPIPLPKTNGIATAKSAEDAVTDSLKGQVSGMPQKALPSVSTNVSAAATTASVAASPVDRKDYLARLQAAKLARKSGPAKASPPQKPPAVTAASSASGVSTPQAVMTPTRKPLVTDEQKARQTELIRQRLEALKAQSKQSVPAPNSAAPNPGSSSATTKQPHTPAAGTSSQQASTTGFPGIPGLFMNRPSNPSNGLSTPSRQPQSIPQKRSAQSDTEVSTPRGSVTPYNRQYGESPYVQQEDSMIIEVSDDESNGSDMDIDDDQASGPPVIRQAPISVPGFPPREGPVPTSQSAVSTPGPQTPATLARTGELSTKEQELARLKLTLKKKLAEQKRIKEAAEAAAAEAAASHGTIIDQTQNKASLANYSQQVQAVDPSQEPTALVNAQSSTSGGDASRDRKRRRRTEIQEQLPSLDDEIASNEAEMARLAKDLEKLKANNDRIMQDKERLTKELENLGIDTEGMSHAVMKATKDEIERAMSPETDTGAQAAESLSQPSLSITESEIPASTSAEIVEATVTESTPPHTQAAANDQTNMQYGFLPGIGQASSQNYAPPIPQSLPPARDKPTASVTENTTARVVPAASAIDVSVLNDRASATPMDDDEDFYSPPPPAEVDAELTGHTAEAPVSEGGQIVADAPSPSEEGEIEMSVSSDEEEEYEPDEPVVEERVIEPQVHQPQLSEPPVEQPQSIAQSQVSTEDEEAYEPPGINEEMSENLPAADAPQLEASSLGEADDGAMDIATSSSEDLDDSDSDSDEGMLSEPEDSGSQMHGAEHDTDVADDLAPELQTEMPVMAVTVAAQPDEVCM